MAHKELGQIHTCNHSAAVTAPGDTFNLDPAGVLTSQLQRMVRHGNFFKVVGIDIGVDTVGGSGGGQVSGNLRYFAPTRGRCAAFRGAFKAMADVMKLQGISMRDNPMYDFRVPINPEGSNALENQATLTGGATANDGLFLTVEGTAVGEGHGVFEIHNRSVQPQYTGTAGNLYQPGFDTLLQSNAAGTDFVLNDTVPFTGDVDYADLQEENIPFMVSWTPDSTDIAVQFEWRPDPALYLAVMTGQFQLYVEEVNLDEGAPGVNLRIAIHIAGWKSIMGNPDKKKRRGKSRRKKMSSNAKTIADLKKIVGVK